MKTAMAVLMAAGVLACSGDSSILTAPRIGDVRLASGDGSAAVSGSGHITLTVADEGFRSFSFHATRDANGVARGRFTLQSRQNDPNGFIKGDIACVSVNGNQAWMVGLVTQSTEANAPVGTYTRFRVADNGEGANAPPDQISLMEVNVVEFPPYCFFMPDRPALRDIEAGNVQVR